MKKVLITIENNNLTFSYKRNYNKISNDLINTNIISNNELVFSDDYIDENIKIIASFIKELVLQYNINQINIKDIKLTLTVLNILDKVDTINCLNISDDETITYEICEKLIKIKKITSLSCYNIPAFMLDLLDKHNIKVVSRSEILFTSSFMQGNNLSQFSKIYYKMSVRIELPLSKEDEEDFITFCKINHYLKSVHINIFNKDGIEVIFNTLIKNRIKNVKIVLHDNITKESQAEYLKRLNRKHKKDKISVKLDYSDNYLEKNIFRQMMVNTLKICGLIIASLVLAVVGYIGYNNHISMQKVTSITNDLEEVIEKTDPTKIIEEIENELDTEVESKVVNDYIASLMTINKDTVGWLEVNNTNVDYPVVQGEDNKKYLDYNYYNEEDRDGWIYMDFRNNSEELSKNTIIYGHNRYYSGVMFGTLYKTAYKSWYGEQENQIIKFDTLYGTMEWQIFSIYKIEKTTDYLKVNFSDDNVWLDFVKMLKERSVYDFGVELGANDKILTLSTCSSNRNMRLVIHAVLKNNE